MFWLGVQQHNVPVGSLSSTMLAVLTAAWCSGGLPLWPKCVWLLCSDQLRSTRSALGDGTSSKASDILGDTGRPFNFETLAKCQGIRLTCISCSAKENELQEVQTFVRQHVRI